MTTNSPPALARDEEIIMESAYKPGSVEGQPFIWDVRRRTPLAAYPGAMRTTPAGFPARSPIWPCSGWGFPCRGRLPTARCALTAPFHPCRRLRAWAVCFLWHCPWARAPQALPGTLSYGARTFLSAHALRLPGRLRGHYKRRGPSCSVLGFISCRIAPGPARRGRSS